MRQYLVSDLLHEGAENGTTLTELVQLTGEDERSIRRRIQTERKAGKLILADCKNGYFLPTSTLDIQLDVKKIKGDRGNLIRGGRCALEDDRAGDLAGVAEWLNEECSQSRSSTRLVS